MATDKDKQDVVKEGHTYDGIQEYDNPLPRWWVQLFWGTIIFSIGYCGYYLTGVGPTLVQSYEADAALAKQNAPAVASNSSVEQQLVSAAKDSAKISAGKAVFAAKCMACHSANGEGLIGPNLTDAAWIHGGSLPQIYKVITEGVPDKGMVAWKALLTEDELFGVIAFVRSIQNTNVAGKEPQGEPSEPTPLN